MLRIQLLIEDYAELMTLSTSLKKVGFDVDSTQNPLGLADSLLRLNADLLIMTAHGRRVSGFDLAKQVKKVRGLPRIVLLHDHQAVPEVDPAVEAWVKSPFDGADLLTTIARICLLNERVLLDKYATQMASAGGSSASGSVASGPPPPGSSTAAPAGRGRLDASTLGDDDRRERYKKFLGAPKPASHGLTAARVREQVKALRKDEAATPDEDLEKERREFVAQLFRKKA